MHVKLQLHGGDGMMKWRGSVLSLTLCCHPRPMMPCPITSNAGFCLARDVCRASSARRLTRLASPRATCHRDGAARPAGAHLLGASYAIGPRTPLQLLVDT